MMGHEGLREAVAAKIGADLPARLQEVRRRLHTDWPPDPKHVWLADEVAPAAGSMPNIYPLVLVRSTDLTDLAPIGPNAGYWGTYSLTVGVLVAARGTDPQSAAVGRDRLMLALRELFVYDQSLPCDDNSQIVLRPYREQTGPAQQTLGSAPLSAGEITMAARLWEPPEPTVPVDATSVTVHPIP